MTAPNYKESTVNFHDADGWKVASPQDAMLRGNWWEVFNDPELNALEDQLNINNENLKVYFQNYMAARARSPKRARNTGRRSPRLLMEPVKKFRKSEQLHAGKPWKAIHALEYSDRRFLDA